MARRRTFVYPPRQYLRAPGRGPRRRTWRVRWELITVPLTAGITLWFISTLDPSCTWSDLCDAVGARNVDLYGRLACLGILLIAVTLCIRILRTPKR